AVRIAVLHGSSLELYVCDVDQDIPESWAGHSRAGEYRALRRQHLLDELRDLAAPLTRQGLDVATVCEWHVPLEQGIGYHVIRTHPDLVVKGTHRHAAVPRVALTRTDWNLIGQIPAPLLLVGTRPWAGRLRIAAAVDSSHPAGYPLALDQLIVDEARGLADALGGTLEVYHVLQPQPHLPGEQAPPQHQAAAHAQARRAIELLAGHNDATTRLAEGGLVDCLVQLVEAHIPDVLVMGTGLRPRRTHSAASGTAAQLLERIGCDLLVVKPPGFISPLLVTDG
ncbi:MAG TPA: universal stress protein, partial [Steroidobacteraceae bacterium]|nr:universal stress protein [Steroidobacteraceae bacterium]